jgi:uncharacterized protein
MVASNTGTPGWTIITGASAGIGVELARLFAADGDPLVLVARRAPRLDALAAELKQAHGTECLVLPLDLADPATPARIIEAVAATGRPIATLVNNAGFGLRGRTGTLPLERQVEMVDVNVRALTELCLRALPDMVARRSGGIMNVGSVASFMPGPGMAVYFATKAFVLSFSEALAEEHRRNGVVVTALCPGPVYTEFQEVSQGGGAGRPFMPPMSAAEVARIGHAAYRRGEAVIVPGWKMKFAAAVPRFLSRAFMRRQVFREHA